MIKTKELFDEAISLPVEIRTQLIDKILRSQLWADEAEKRVEEIKNGKVKTIRGEEVFKKIHDRLSS